MDINLHVNDVRSQSSVEKFLKQKISLYGHFVKGFYYIHLEKNVPFKESNTLKRCCFKFVLFI